MRLTSILGAACLLLLVGSAPVEAKDDLPSIRRVLATNQDPEVRIAQIPKLVANGTEGAAVLLGWLVEHDATLAVRIGAAEGLGRVRTENAATLLLQQIRRGGPRALRAALADALGRAPKPTARVLKAVTAARRSRLERALLLDALRALTDDATREKLVHTTWDGDHALRYAAIRALANRKDAVPERTATLGRLLAEAEDVESPLRRR